MKRTRLSILSALLIGVIGLAACPGDDTNQDAAPPDLGVGEGVFPDGFTNLWDCDNPGGLCNAHDTCVLSAVCGSDRKCHPKQVQNCNDGLDCTQDICKGKGVCVNLPKTGTCALPVKVEQAGKVTTELRCFNKGDRSPEDTCLICNPGTADGGTKANEWASANDGACDDKNPCTKDDYCQQGTCKGTDFSQKCSDNLSCTEDLCDGKGECQGNKLRPDWCLIAKVCYKDKQTDQSGCNICDVAKAQDKWTPVGVHCVIANKCYQPGDKDTTGCGQCDPAKNPNDWTPITGLCKIGTVCWKAGALNTGGCAECDPTVSATTWTVKGNDCLINDVCKKPGDKDSTGCASCDPSKSKTSWSTVANMCKIGTSCFADQAKHPQGCAICDPATSSTAWTVNSNQCLINNQCTQPGVKDTSQCASCDPTKSKTDWTPLPGLCKISGKCYTAGQKDPTQCAECDPAVSSTAWTVKDPKCLIGTTCYTPGQTSTNGCGTCEPTKNKYDWSPVQNKCMIGQTCVANLAKDATGCLMCDVAKNASGWTPVAGVSSTAFTFDDGKNPPTGWTIKNSDTKVGWVVSNNRAAQGSYSLYYGDPAVKNYDTSGNSNSGTADMPAITLTAGKKAGLSFWIFMDTESGSSYDTLEIFVNGKSVWTKPSTLVTDPPSWKEVTIDLSTYAGQSVVIQFSFDTQDDMMNDTEGLFIDSVTVYHNC